MFLLRHFFFVLDFFRRIFSDRVIQTKTKRFSALSFLLFRAQRTSSLADRRYLRINIINILILFLFFFLKYIFSNC